MQRMNHKIAAGVLWNLAGLFMSRGSMVVFTVFLARFLAPEAFGLIAMMTVAFQLANVLVESGLGQALIRSKTVSQIDLSTAFFANLGLSALAYAALLLAAPYVADFYDQPDLTLLVRVAGLVVFLNAFKVVQIATLGRTMNFRVEMKAATLGAIVSGALAVTLAYAGAGVWSLVAQMLVAAGVSSAVLWLASDWRPSFIFSGGALAKLFGFGSNLALEGVLEVLYQNAYILVIGYMFSAELTGLYFFARKLVDLIAQQLTRAVQQATFPALATLQDEDTALRHKYRRIVQMMMFMITPLMLLLAALAEPLFGLLFEQRWNGAILYVQLLALAGVLYPLHALNLNVLNVKGRPDLILRVGILKKTVNLVLLGIAVPFGVTGIVVGQVLGSLLALIPNTYYSQKLIGYGLREQAIDALKPLLAGAVAAVAAIVCSFLLEASLVLQLGIGGAVGLLMYLAASLLFGAEGCTVALRKALEMRQVAVNARS